MMIDLFLSLAEAIAPAQAPTPPPVPTTPPAIIRRVAEKRPALPPVATVTKHRLADVTGQQFEHEDLEYLRGWIAQRNAALSAPRSQAPQPQVLYFYPAAGSRRCGPSGCR